jgi:hypothetical protein
MPRPRTTRRPVRPVPVDPALEWRGKAGRVIYVPASPPRDLTEEQWQGLVEDLARYCGFRTFHDRDSRGNNPGLPDLLLIRPPRIIFAELKTQKGRVRTEQTWWAADLRACPGVEYALWRPSDWQAVLAALLPDGATVK